MFYEVLSAVQEKFRHPIIPSHHFLVPSHSQALQTLQDAVLKELEEFESPNGSTRAEPQRRQLSHLLMFVFDGMAGGVPHGLGNKGGRRL